MAIRTTELLVKEVLGNNYDGRTSIYPFMRGASIVVDRVAACAITKEIPRTTAELREIETWLAGHFYAHHDQLYTSKSTSGAGASFQGQTAMHLNSTQYGQMAMTLDTSGCLADIQAGVTPGAGRPVASGVWLGKRRSEQIDYPQRD